MKIAINLFVFIYMAQSPSRNNAHTDIFTPPRDVARRIRNSPTYERSVEREESHRVRHVVILLLVGEDQRHLQKLVVDQVRQREEGDRAGEEGARGEVARAVADLLSQRGVVKEQEA